MSCGVGRRLGSDPSLLWQWCRPAAVAPTRPLAWEPPYATGAALEMAERQKKHSNQSIRKLENTTINTQLQNLKNNGKNFT